MGADTCGKNKNKCPIVSNTVQKCPTLPDLCVDSVRSATYRPRHRRQISSANGDHMTRQLRVAVLSGLFLLSSLMISPKLILGQANFKSVGSGSAPLTQSSGQS